MLTPQAEEPQPEHPAAAEAEETPAGRRWLSSGADIEPTRTARTTGTGGSGGTLFERMSSIARGAAKAQVDEDRPSERRDSNDLPGFLNRQNNQ
jgi:cell division protein FtsZ